MSQSVDVHGMVLFSAPYGEYDRRVILLTSEKGKITAFARGARKMGSRLMAATSPMCLGTFSVYEGKSAYTLVGAEITSFFETLRGSIEDSCHAMYFLELAQYYGRENLEASDMLNLLYVTLRALEKKVLSRKLIRYIYEIRLMVINGEYPMDPEGETGLSGTARYALGVIYTAPLQNLYGFTLSEEVLREIALRQDAARARMIDRKIKSLDVLTALCP